jgi:hypothetical protein
MDASGTKPVAIKQSDLDDIVSGYRPSTIIRQIAVGIGRITDDSPAWGWVREMKRDGESLYGDISGVPEFEDMLRKKMFTMRACELGEPSILGEKKLQIARISFLGAQPPKLPSLSGYSMSSYEAGNSTWIEFPATTMFDHKTMLEDCFSEGKLRSDSKKIVLQFREAMQHAYPHGYTFSDGRKRPPADAFMEFLQEYKPNLAIKALNLSDRLDELAKKRRKLDPNLSYGEAFMEVQRDYPHLAREYQAIMYGDGGGQAEKKQNPNPKRCDKIGNRLNQLTEEKMRNNTKLTYSEAFSEVQMEYPELVREYTMTRTE